MPEEFKNRDTSPVETAAEEAPGTIFACWKKYSAAVEASDKKPETLKGLWDKYIAALKKTPRTLSGCSEEYSAAVKALGSDAESPGAKSELWKTYMTLVKDHPVTPKNLADTGWTVPEKGDHLSFYRGGLTPANERDVIFALPSSLKISNPNFVFPALTGDEIARFVNDRVGVQLPSLWAETSKGSNVLTVEVNGRSLSNYPLDIVGMDDGEAVAGEVRLAVRRGLAAALAQIKILEERHELGTAEPGPYRLAFNLGNIETEDSAARLANNPGKPSYEQGK